MMTGAWVVQFWARENEDPSDVDIRSQLLFFAKVHDSDKV